MQSMLKMYIIIFKKNNSTHHAAQFRVIKLTNYILQFGNASSQFNHFMVQFAIRVNTLTNFIIQFAITDKNKTNHTCALCI